MTQQPFQQPFQPDPYGPPAVPQPPRRPPLPAWRRFGVPAVLGVVLAVGGFAGGYVFANANGTTSRTNGTGTFNGGADGSFAPGASGRPRNGAGGFGGGGAAGTVGSVSSDQMTVSTQGGGSRIILLTPTTTVTEVTAATKAVSDIKSGDTVTVIGTPNPDGSVTAQRVVVGDLGAFGGRGFGGGPNGSRAPGGSPPPPVAS